MGDSFTEGVFEDAIRCRLAARGVTLNAFVWTTNRSRLVSSRREARRRHLVRELRVSRRLLPLGDKVVGPIVDFVSDRAGGRERLRGIFDALPTTPRPRRRRALTSKGMHHRLDELMGEAAEISGVSTEGLTITWGIRRRRSFRQKTIRLGSYDPRTLLIRIHPLLDHPLVPAWFVVFVISHELFHHAVGITRSGGRRRVHPPEFRLLEQAHPFYDDAMRWEREHLPLLMAGRLRGRVPHGWHGEERHDGR